jgi:hypothetical protein
LGAEKVAVVTNFSKNAQTVRVPVGDLWKNGTELRSLLNHEKYAVREGVAEVSLSAWSGVWLGR